MPAATCCRTTSATPSRIVRSNVAAVVALAALLEQQLIHDGLAARQAADMGGEDAIGAEFHAKPCLRAARRPGPEGRRKYTTIQASTSENPGACHDNPKDRIPSRETLAKKRPRLALDLARTDRIVGRTRFGIPGAPLAGRRFRDVLSLPHDCERHPGGRRLSGRINGQPGNVLRFTVRLRLNTSLKPRVKIAGGDFGSAESSAPPVAGRRRSRRRFTLLGRRSSDIFARLIF